MSILEQLNLKTDPTAGKIYFTSNQKPLINAEAEWPHIKNILFTLKNIEKGECLTVVLYYNNNLFDMFIFEGE